MEMVVLVTLRRNFCLLRPEVVFLCFRVPEGRYEAWQRVSLQRLSSYPSPGYFASHSPGKLASLSENNFPYKCMALALHD